ncbi:MAG: hypothetical protein E7299_08900 [Lachnospiraceae bacterium]|nr:hypothetical protein [Lachnospiraceae bacterium]
MENEKMNVQNQTGGKIPTAQLPTKFMLIVRIAAGAYVAYAGYSVKDGLASVAGAEKVFLTAAAIAFPIIGILLIIHSIRALMAGKYVDGAMDAGAGQDAEEVEDASKKRITFSEDDDIELEEEVPEEVENIEE